MSETEIGQIRLPESQIGLLAGTGFPVWVGADSRSENPDPIHNNIRNHNSKTHTGRILNNMIENFLGHVSGYVSRERGVTVVHPKELQQAHVTRRIWSNALQYVNFTPDTTLVSISAGFSVV